MIKQAVIVAGGQGIRLGSAGKVIPKGLLTVGSQQLVPRSVRLLRVAGIESIVIGTGHLARRFETFFHDAADVTCVLNERFAETGSMGTLYKARRSIAGDFLLLESDILYETRAIETVLAHPAPTVVLLSHFTRAGDECYVGHDGKGGLVNISKDVNEIAQVAGELVGITKISQEVFSAMCTYWEKHRESLPKMNYEDALVGVAPSVPVAVTRVDGLVWCEIDTPEHHTRADTLIMPQLMAMDKATAEV